MAEREIGRVGRLAEGASSIRTCSCTWPAYITLCQGLARGRGCSMRSKPRRQQLRRGLPRASRPVADALGDALPGRGRARADPARCARRGGVVLHSARRAADREHGGGDASFRAERRTAVAAFVIRAAQDFAGAGYEQPLVGSTRWEARSTIRPADDDRRRACRKLRLHSLSMVRRSARQSRIACARRWKRSEAISYRTWPLVPTIGHSRVGEVGGRKRALGPTPRGSQRFYRELACRS